MRFKVDNNILVLYFEGELNSYNADNYEKEIEDIIKNETFKSIILDFSNLHYISSAGLRIILKLKQKYDEVSVVEASLEVFDVLSMTGFTNIMTVKKKINRVYISGAQVIGEGFFSTVYRIDKDTIIKVFNRTSDPNQIERELNLSKKAFVLGIPTAISFDIVRVDDKLGVRFEMLDCISLKNAFLEHPEKYDELIHKYVNLLKKINTTDCMDPSIPDMRKMFLEKIDLIKEDVGEKYYKKARKMLEAIPETMTFVHGDCHFKNIMVQGEDFLLIDMDTLSRGDPIFEIALLRAPYIAFEEDSPGNNEQFLGASSEFCQKLYNDIIVNYFGKDDQIIKDKIALVCYIHMVWWTKVNTPEDKKRLNGCKERLLALLDKYDDLKVQQMDNNERAKYLEAYYANEADANKQMSFANAFAALVASLLLILYITHIFPIRNHIVYTSVIFTLPFIVLILLTPLFYVFKKPELLKKPSYKNYVVFSFLFCIFVLNILVPKHGIIGWPLCIIMVNHYYNQKFGRLNFIMVLISMLICLYASLFIGEFDANLLLGNDLLRNGTGANIDTPKDRYDLLHAQLVNGENRYLKIFLYYYLSRAALITLIFFVSDALNKRTYNLLVSDIKISSEQQKTKTELEVAKEIQLATLPTDFVTSKDVEIQAQLKAAKEVGGDFYDYFVLGDKHVAVVIGDVSGKGIPAAMFMMKAITCFKNYISLNRTPAEILKLVNKTIYESNDSKMFVTCFLAIINTETGEMKYANAGHNPPIVGQKQNYHFLKCDSGFILGALKDALVMDEEATLNNGDTITLYTDGITEAMNGNREQYGEKRLLELFNKKDYSCLVELHHELKDDVEKFVNGAEQSDDMTFITVKYHGDEYVYNEKIFKAKKENTPGMLDYLKEFSFENKFDEGFVNNLLVVGDELLSNIVKYGYEDENGEIFLRLLYNLDKKEFVVTIIDTGKEFNPFSVNNGPLEGDISKRKEGGLGILIVKKLMSEYAYDRVYNKNIVILKKKF